MTNWWWPARPAHELNALGAALAGLVWPVQCAGCGRDDVALCRCCAQTFAGPPLSFERGAGVPVWALTAYGGRPAQLIVAWKEHGRRDLTRPLGQALAGAVRSALDEGGAQGRASPGAVLVPMPARRSAVRRRGADLPLGLARVAGSLTGTPVVPALRHTRRVRDQVGLAAADRHRNLAGALAVAPGWRSALTGRICVVIDDIVTTGASTGEAARALTAGGARVVGVCCLSVTLVEQRVLEASRRTSLSSWKAPSGR